MSQVPDAGFTVTLLTGPDARTPLVCLAGEVDLAALPVLSDVADRLSAMAPAAGVTVDLAGVTFASATLPHFLLLLRHALPADSPLTVCRSTSRIRRLLDVTGVERIVTLRAELPACYGGAAALRAGAFSAPFDG